MDDNPVSRRRLLGVSAVAAVPVLSGCASVVDQTDSEPERTSTNASAPQNTATNATESDAATENGTATDDQVAPGDRPETISEPDIDVPSSSLLEERPRQRYPTLGTADTTVTLYGNWKCPYTQEFVNEQFDDLVDDFVATGDVSVEFRNVAYVDGEPYLGEDAPRATEAGLAVWDIDPSSFWDYFAYVFANQPQGRFEWATTDNLVRFAEHADVDGLDQIRQAIRSRTYNRSVEQSAERADGLEITTVPRVAYGDSVTAPTVDPESTREQFERAADGASGSGDDSSGGNGTATDGN
ncbi:DsbA family protein [Halorubrum depositum]|uniref:DsbA family protein n=1 Tax=Halorubrum depositum TaxID=2583992 RepID=UPI0011A1E565|nr:thioredoxin domain-containing protein [Halorubrum depositum]